MTHNGSTVFNLPESNIRQRIVNIFGSKANEKLVPVSEETEIVKVSGFALKPQFARKSRGEQFFFVNDRFIKSPYLHHAVNSAFEGLIKDGMHPGYFLFLEVEPTSIDINIHPTKTEIKFDDEHAIYAMLRATVKHSLGQFSVAPVLDFDKDSSFDTPYEYSKKSPVAPTIEVDQDFNPFKSGGGKGAGGYTKFKDKSANWESLYVGLKDEFRTMPSKVDATEIEFESEEVSGRLFDTNETEKGQFSFQLQNKYILSPIKSGLMVIHQHLAHQRILYEEFLQNITVKEAVSQQLLFPLELEFSKPDMDVLAKVREALENTGFQFDIFSEEKLTIAGTPVALKHGDIGELLEQLIADIKNEVPDASFSMNDLLAKSMARGMAVRTGTVLNIEEREHLVNRLFACKEPSVSPDNTTVVVTLDVNDLDKRFK
jgi:DNA mismatch repair protein MutL